VPSHVPLYGGKAWPALIHTDVRTVCVLGTLCCTTTQLSELSLSRNQLGAAGGLAFAAALALPTNSLQELDLYANHLGADLRSPGEPLHTQTSVLHDSVELAS
jgi:hypothetical protein